MVVSRWNSDLWPYNASPDVPLLIVSPSSLFIIFQVVKGTFEDSIRDASMLRTEQRHQDNKNTMVRACICIRYSACVPAYERFKGSSVHFPHAHATHAVFPRGLHRAVCAGRSPAAHPIGRAGQDAPQHSHVWVEVQLAGKQKRMKQMRSPESVYILPAIDFAPVDYIK